MVKAPKVIKAAGDFVGMDGALTALNRMLKPGKFRFLFGSDTLADAHALAAHKPGTKAEKMYDDVTKRTKEEEEADGEVDLYITTPPCQPYSTAGRRRGTKDARGKLVAASVKYIVHNRPKVVVLENVKGFSYKKFAQVKKGITKALKQAQPGYSVHWRLLASNQFQVPQRRVRTIMVAFRKDVYRSDRPFHWPDPVDPVVHLEDVLDPPIATDKPGRLPSNKKAKVFVKRAYKKAHAQGINPLVTPILVDVDCSDKFQTAGINIAPTLTKTRGSQGGPWVSSRGRRTSVSELIKIQGFQDKEVPWVEAGLSPSKIGMLLGNSVPPPLIGAVLSEAMYSAGITVQKVPFPRFGE